MAEWWVRSWMRVYSFSTCRAEPRPQHPSSPAESAWPLTLAASTPGRRTGRGRCGRGVRAERERRVDAGGRRRSRTRCCWRPRPGWHSRLPSAIRARTPRSVPAAVQRHPAVRSPSGIWAEPGRLHRHPLRRLAVRHRPRQHRPPARMRALCDAVVVGAGTVAADDPQLTTRHVVGPPPAAGDLRSRRAG